MKSIPKKEFKDNILELRKSQYESQSIKLSNVKTKPIKWLYPGKIPRGKITILAGDPDVGKTFLTLDIAARVSTGTKWPDGSHNQRGDVLIMSAEDDLGDTIKPRLEAAGANLDRIQALTHVEKQIDSKTEPVEAPPTLTEDFDIIKREISILKPKLIIIDPLNAYLAGVDTHRDAELRTVVFAPLKKMAEDHEIAVICVMHLNKSNTQSAKQRISGSIAYVAASRATWLITNDKDEHRRKLMMPVKFNIGPMPDGLAYKIIENENKEPVLAWEKDPVEIKADEALSPDNTSSAPEREYAKEFLREMLADGPVSAPDIFEEAEAHDISERTLKRAKKKLNIRTVRQYEEGKRGVQGWTWELSKV